MLITTLMQKKIKLKFNLFILNEKIVKNRGKQYLKKTQFILSNY